MQEITAEQFLENVKDWKPKKDFLALASTQLRLGQTPEGVRENLAKAFFQCSQSTYDFIQFIHELATTRQIDRKNFIPQVAQLVGLVQTLQDAAREYREEFKKYDALTRPELAQDEFDTIYYDAIQNMDLRGLLKKIIEEVELVLQSFSLVSGDLSGIQCIGLYESSIRFHLFLQYFMAKEKFSLEEMWSILFDIYNQLGEMESLSIEPTEEELRDLHEKYPEV